MISSTPRRYQILKVRNCQNESRNALVNISPLETHVLPQAIVFNSDRWKMSGCTYSYIEIVSQNGVLFPLCIHSYCRSYFQPFLWCRFACYDLSFETSGMPCTKIFTMSSFLMCIARNMIFTYFVAVCKLISITSNLTTTLPPLYIIDYLLSLYLSLIDSFFSCHPLWKFLT